MSDDEALVRQRLARLAAPRMAYDGVPPALSSQVASQPPPGREALGRTAQDRAALPDAGPGVAGNVADAGDGRLRDEAAVVPAPRTSVPPGWPGADDALGGFAVDPPAPLSTTLDADRGPSLLGGPGAFDPGRRGVKALAVVAVVVVLGAAFLAYRARPRVEPVPSPSTAALSPPPEPVASTTSAASEVVVAVAGRVRRPGLVRLPAGSRVADAVEAAGGALPGTDLATINLARKLADGEMILVGVTPPPGLVVGPGGPGGPGGAGPDGGPGGGPGSGKVNLNTATLAELDALPGVGPVLAQRILDHREANGGFRNVGELRNVDGIGDTRFEELKDLVTV